MEWIRERLRNRRENQGMELQNLMHWHRSA